LRPDSAKPAKNVGRCMTKGLADFCKQHRIALNWALFGMLADLRHMLRQPEPKPEPSTEEFLRLLARCSAADRKRVVLRMRDMVDGGARD
jgi:hypothetical protein